MSRSIKGAKSQGYEYWTKRPCNGIGGIPGKHTKKLTHKIERQNNKTDVLDPKVPSTETYK